MSEDNTHRHTCRSCGEWFDCINDQDSQKACIDISIPLCGSCVQREYLSIKERQRNCAHKWNDTYYGTTCSVCKLFYPSGCAPWEAK
jgi:hypothetical protein